MTQSYVTVCCYVINDCCLSCLHLAGCLYFVNALFSQISEIVLYLQPPLPTIKKHLYISANTSYSKYYSGTLAHFLPICMKTMKVAVKQGQQGPDNMGYKETVPSQDEMIIFYKTKTKALYFGSR